MGLEVKIHGVNQDIQKIQCSRIIQKPVTIDEFFQHLPEVIQENVKDDTETSQNVQLSW